jgi:hypothetical protein
MELLYQIGQYADTAVQGKWQKYVLVLAVPQHKIDGKTGHKVFAVGNRFLHHTFLKAEQISRQQLIKNSVNGLPRGSMDHIGQIKPLHRMFF